MVSVFRRHHVCIANTENYAIVDIENGSLTPLLPISQVSTSLERPSPPATLTLLPHCARLPSWTTDQQALQQKTHQ